jgi:hypothetical protein
LAVRQDAHVYKKFDINVKAVVRAAPEMLAEGAAHEIATLHVGRWRRPRFRNCLMGDYLEAMEPLCQCAVLFLGSDGNRRSHKMAWSDKFDHPFRWGAQRISTLQEARIFILALPSFQRTFPT